MSNIFVLSRTRMFRKRAAAALAAAGALVMSSGLVLLNAPAASANGNNGTVKVQGIDLDGHANDPKLPCTFDVNWSGFDAQTVTAEVTFSLQDPTDEGKGYALVSTGGQTSLSFVGTAGHTETYTPIISGEAKGTNGYHVNITVVTESSVGTSLTKSKTFWVAACGNPTPTDACQNLPGQQPAGTPCTAPAPEVSADRVEGTPDCVAGTVPVTTTTTTTPYKFDPTTNTWVLDPANATTTVTVSSRPATAAECPVSSPKTGTLATLSYVAIGNACGQYGSITQPGNQDNVAYTIQGGDWNVREGTWTVTATLTNGATSFANPAGWTVTGDHATREVALGTYSACGGPTDDGRTPIHPNEPSWIEATCTTGPNVVYHDAAGVSYTVDPTPAPGTKVTVTASLADPVHYYIAEATTLWWDHTFQAAPSWADCHTAVTPIQPTFREATCTAAPGISYHPVTGVTYDADDETPAAGQRVTVTARAVGQDADGKGYYIADNTTSSWTHKFAAVPTDCGSDNPTPGDPTPGDPTPGNPSPSNPAVVSPLYPTVNPATCAADGSLNLPTQPAGVLVEQTGDVPGDVSFHFTPAAGYVFPAGTVTDVTLTVAPRKTGTACGEVLGTESSAPTPTSHTHAAHPSRAPTVLGTEAVVPTAVDAGLASWPGTQPAASERGGLLAQGLLGGGLLLLVAAGCLGLGLRSRGGHEF